MYQEAGYRYSSLLLFVLDATTHIILIGSVRKCWREKGSCALLLGYESNSPHGHRLHARSEKALAGRSFCCIANHTYMGAYMVTAYKCIWARATFFIPKIHVINLGCRRPNILPFTAEL